MTLPKAIRDLIKIHNENGLKPKEIYSAIGKICRLSTVYLWIKKFNKGQFEPLKIPGRSNSSTTPNNIRKIKRYLSENKFMRQISRIIKLPRSSVRRIVKKNLNLKCACACTCTFEKILN